MSLRLLFMLTLTLVFSVPAWATDGVLEINQTCATGGGCFPGDTGGYPIRITSSGSYIVTSNLDVSGDLDGIRVEADDVTIDMNGFRLLSTGSTNTSVNGIEAFGRQNFEVRGGTVEGFRGRGVFVSAGGGIVSHGGRVLEMRTVGNGFQGVDMDGGGHLISRCTSVNNDLWGFSMQADGIIIDSVAENNAQFGLQLEGGAYRNTVVSNNNGGNANAQITGAGVDLGGNLCGGDAICP